MDYTISGQELETLRKACKLRLLISTILAAAVYLAFLCFSLWVFFLGTPEMRARLGASLPEKIVTGLGAPVVIAVLAWAFFYWLLVKPDYNRFNSLFKNKYVVSTIQETGLFQDLRYQPQGGLTHDEIRNAAVVACGDKRRFESEDLLSGCYQGLRFRYCDVSTARMKGVGKNHREEVLFHGQVMHFASFDEHKRSAGHLQIFEKKLASDLIGWTAEHEIQTESEAFNRRFRVFAADEHNAFYILTPKMMEQITQFADQANAQIAISFCGSSMFVAIDRLYSILDASFHVPVPEQKQLILKDVELLRQAGELLILEASSFHERQNEPSGSSFCSPAGSICPSPGFSHR